MSTLVATAPATSRTRRVIHQAAFGLAARIGALVASFAAMPLMLRVLGSESLGVWLVLLSVFQWITFFDLGVAAGARNEIAKAAAANDDVRVRSAIATGWLYTALIAASLFGVTTVLLAASPFSTWLRTAAFNGIDATNALWLVAAGSCASFALSYIQSVYAALEKASAFSVFSLLSNLSFLALLALASHFASHVSGGSILQVCILYLVAMVAANGCLIVLFLIRFPQYRPRLSNVDHRIRGRMLGLGIKLFAIQVAAMIIFTTSRLMASVLLGPASVVVYDAAFKLFSMILIFHTLVMSTLWSSFTQAYERREWNWIAKSLSRLIQLTLPLALGCAVLAKLSPWLISAWLGAAQVGPSSLYAWFGAVTVLSCWSNIFSYFLNGVGHTKVQFFSAMVAAAINIPISYLFAVPLKQGLTGLLMGTFVSLTLFAVAGPIQAYKLVKAGRAA